MQIATTSTVPVKVVMTWPETAGVTSYNVFRKRAADSSYPTNPLNSTPLTVFTSCNAIKAVMPPGSPAWNSIADGLAVAGVPFNPCSVATVARGSQGWLRLQALASAQWQVAIILGQGYVDSGVPLGPYSYAVAALNGARLYGATIVAGVPAQVPAPSGLASSSGDGRVLLYWTGQQRAVGYAVSRGVSATGPFEIVSASAVPVEVTQLLDGTTIPASQGFLDMAQWTPEGEPAGGPQNRHTYYYRVASIDLLGRKGPWSAVVQATPLDMTPPATPMDFAATANDALHRIELRWSVVQMDVDGHVDSSGVTSYRVYRYEDANAPPNAGALVGGDIPAPPSPTLTVESSDGSSVLVPAYGEKTFWYRVQAIDGAGNAGGFSAAVAAHLKDFTPPAPVAGLAAMGYDDYIKLTWTANTEPDLDGYAIYRSLCSNGICNPCDPVTEKRKQANPCTGPYALIAMIGLPSTPATAITFEDHTIPSRSPVCYSYWIRAFDRAQNRSGGLPNAINVPDAADKTVCARLVDKTPPEAAIITGLLARNDSVQVQWIGAPVQDIAAYHVYRSDQKDTGYSFVGGMTVALPPATPTALTSPYTPPVTVGCDGIPLVPIESLSVGSFVDHGVRPKRTYWYKVVGIDQSGNEASLNGAVPISTFTYTTTTPSTPTITAITTTTSQVGLAIAWSPPFDATTVAGYAVFRSDSATGFYRQVGSIVRGNQYVDAAVVKGIEYWYKVAALSVSGQLSPTSAASRGIP